MKISLFIGILLIAGCASKPKHSILSQKICDDINRGEQFKYTNDYSEVFQKALPQEQLATLFGQVKKEYGDCLEVVDYKQSPQKSKFSTKHKSQKILDLNLVENDGIITGLWLLGERAKPVSYKDFNAALLDFKNYDDSRLFIKVDKKILADVASKKRTPLGSIFKLFILDALISEVKKGKSSWDQELAINDSWKSLPSGEMQNEKAGAKFTLFDYAAKMISISDNTATDHLFYHLGRNTIERQMKIRGLSNSFSWTRPFLTTLELFKIRAQFSPLDYKQYAAGNRTTRLRKIQDAQIINQDDFMKEIMQWHQPRGLYDAEWFSTPREICQLLETFSSAKDENVEKILGLNTPFIEKDEFNQVLYKGGSEPGLVQMAYYIKSNETPICLYAGVINQSQAIDETAFFEKVKGIIKLLPKQQDAEEK